MSASLDDPGAAAPPAGFEGFGHDPRSSSSLSLAPSLSDATADQPRRTLLIVYIHGFMGNDTSFQSFPAHVHSHLKLRLADSHVIHSKIYPRYKTYKAIEVARDNFSEWLAPHESETTDVVLAGHSMGGLLAAEVILQPSTCSSGRLFRHRILGILNLDAPLLGLHPGIVVSGISSLFRKKPETPQPFGPSRQPTADPNFNAEFANDVRIQKRSWFKNIAHFVTKHNSEGLLDAATNHIVSHLEFGSCLMDIYRLKDRYQTLRKLEDLDPYEGRGAPRAAPRVRFAQYYTMCHGYPKSSPQAKEESQEEEKLWTPLRGPYDPVDDPSDKPSKEEIDEAKRARNYGLRELNERDHPKYESKDESSAESDQPPDLGHASSHPTKEVTATLFPIPGEYHPRFTDVQTDRELIKLGFRPPPLASEDWPDVPKWPPLGKAPSKSSSAEEKADWKQKWKEYEESYKKWDEAATKVENAAKQRDRDIGQLKKEQKERITALGNMGKKYMKDMGAGFQKDAFNKEVWKMVANVQNKPAEWYDTRIATVASREVKLLDALAASGADAARHTATSNEGGTAEQESDASGSTREAAEPATGSSVVSGDQHPPPDSKALDKGKGKATSTTEQELGASGSTQEATERATGSPVVSNDQLSAPDSMALDGEGKETPRRKPPKDRKFCNLPAKVDGQRDPLWIEVFMKDVDEVAAHTGLFFPGPHYEKLVGDVGDIIVQWVQDDLTVRTVLEMEEPGNS